MLPSTVLLVAALGSATPAPASPPQDDTPERTSHLGVPRATLDALERPVAAAFGPAGDTRDALWVAELGAEGARLRALGGVDVTLEGHTTGRTLAVLGEGILVEPHGLAVDDGGRVYVADTGAHAVLQLTPGDDAPTRLADRGNDLPRTLFPRDVALDGDTLWVADLLGVLAIDLTDGTGTRLACEGLERADALQPVPSPDGGAPRLAVFDAARQSVDLFAADGTLALHLAHWGPFPGQVSAPGGLAWIDGLLAVADTENHRVQFLDPAFEDAGTRRPLAYRFGIHAIRPGEGDGALHYPADIAVRADGALVALPEPLDDRVQIFGRGDGPEPATNPLRAGIGQPAAHLGPRVAASGTFLATLSPESHEVQIHDLRGDRPLQITAFGDFGTRFGLFRTPVGIALGDAGRTLVVTDEGSRRLSRVRLDVRPDQPVEQNLKLATFVDGVELARLDRPAGDEAPLPGAVAIVGEGDARRIAVVDRANERVLWFGPDLTVVARSTAGLGEIAGLFPVDAGRVLATVRRGPEGPQVLELDETDGVVRAFGAGVLTGPEAAVRIGDLVFVSDPARDRVERFRRDGETFVHDGGFGGRGLGLAEFHDPRGLAVLSGPDAPRLVVLDHGNHRGQIFDAEGNFLDGFGGRLYTAPLRAR